MTKKRKAEEVFNRTENVRGKIHLTPDLLRLTLYLLAYLLIVFNMIVFLLAMKFYFPEVFLGTGALVTGDLNAENIAAHSIPMLMLETILFLILIQIVKLKKIREYLKK